MTRGLAATWMLAITASLVGMTSASIRYAQARREGLLALERHERTRRDVDRLATLRSRIPPCIVTDGAPKTPLTPRLHESLAAIGLAPTSLASVHSEAQTRTAIKGLSSAIGQDTLALQRIGVRLQDLTLPQLGSFLATWRRLEPCWRIASIEVAPAPMERRSKSIATGGGDLPLLVGLTLERLQLDHGGARGRP